MQDVFARIGLAFHHILDQSSVNGPAREEVKRLADELQSFEGGINDIVNQRVAAEVEGIEGRIMSHVDTNFDKLADVLEEASILFEPMPAPLPGPVAEPATEAAAPADAAPVSTTGHIPAAPQPEPEPVEGAAVEPAVEPAAAPVEAPAAEAVVEPEVQPAPAEAEAPVEPAPEVEAAPAEAEAVVEPAAVDPNDPDQMTIAQATQWLDDHQLDHAGVTLRDDLRDLVRKAQAAEPAPTATGAADTTIMVGDGKTDVVG